MDINYLGILICALIAMIIGALWYGPLFGRVWMHINGATALDKEARQKMQKETLFLYIVQFLLTVFQVFVFSQYITQWSAVSGIDHALWIWAAFIVPTIAASAMWNTDTARVRWTRFGIQAGYQLIIFILFGLILRW